MPVNYSGFQSDIKNFLDNQQAEDTQDAANQIADIYVSAWNQGTDALFNGITVQAGPIASGFKASFDIMLGPPGTSSNPGTWGPASTGLTAAGQSAIMEMGTPLTVNAIAPGGGGVTPPSSLHSAFTSMNTAAVAAALASAFLSHVGSKATVNAIGTTPGASSII